MFPQTFPVGDVRYTLGQLSHKSRRLEYQLQYFVYEALTPHGRTRDASIAIAEGKDRVRHWMREIAEPIRILEEEERIRRFAYDLDQAELRQIRRHELLRESTCELGIPSVISDIMVDYAQGLPGIAELADEEQLQGRTTVEYTLEREIEHPLPHSIVLIILAFIGRVGLPDIHDKSM